MNTINIFDPKEKPFGWLSNNRRFLMSIDGKNWPTVTNYIYGSMVKTPSYRQMLSVTPVKDVQKQYNELLELERNNIVISAVSDALDVKVKNKGFAELLLSTENSPIIYASSNPLLGIGHDNKGKNMYGKYLMQKRHNIRIGYKKEKEQLEKENRDQLLYDLYLADKGLRDRMNDGYDIQEFINLSPSAMVDKLGRKNLVKIMPKRDVILEIIHKEKQGLNPYRTIESNYGIEKYIKNPNNLILEIRKRGIRKLKARKMKERKEIVLDMYLDYLLEKNFPDVNRENYNEIRNQTFYGKGKTQKSQLENRLYNLYEEGMLSERLSTMIDEKISTIHIPTDRDVFDAENVSIVYTSEDVSDEVSYQTVQGDPIVVYPVHSDEIPEKFKKYIDLSPARYGGIMLNIEGKIYPTISHYIFTKLLANLPGGKKDTLIGNMTNAYKNILISQNAGFNIENFKDPSTISNIYLRFRSENDEKRLKEYASKGLDKKFENRVLQDVLLMTENANLVWSDFSDPILGVGPKDVIGENFVGEYLMKLRKKIEKSREGETFEKLNITHINEIISDMFVRDWMTMRIKDMCRVIHIVKDYLWSKYGISAKIDSNIAEAVLDKIYQPCSQIYGVADKITVSIPHYFNVLIRGCPGFSNVEKDVVEVIWKRFAVMIYYLLKYLEDSSLRNIRTVIGKIEYSVSNSSKCIEIVPDEKENCIASAIINLLHGISSFNKQLSYNNTITHKDINLATAIILNEKEKKEKAPVVDEEYEFISEMEVEKQGEDEESEGEGEDEESEGEEEGGEEEDEESGFSPNNGLLAIALEEIDGVENGNELVEYMNEAIEKIKIYKIPEKIKTNRVNFFATQRE